MQGHVILSHGLESGPHASKVTALASVAEALGWRATRPDYRDLDALGMPACVAPRIARIRVAVHPGERTVLAGSSMGAFTSALAAREFDCAGLFLMALPPGIPDCATPLDAPPVPTALVHGWHDELCPVAAVIDFAGRRGDELTLVNDTHRLAAHVDFCAERFHLFLRGLDAVAAGA